MIAYYYGFALYVPSLNFFIFIINLGFEDYALGDPACYLYKPVKKPKPHFSVTFRSALVELINIALHNNKSNDI